MPRDLLGPFEFQVLSAVATLPGRAYGVTILDKVGAHTGRQPSVGALYTTLERLEKKGFVTSFWGDPTPERGGRRKRFYRVQAPGFQALETTQAVQRRASPWPGWEPQEA